MNQSGIDSKIITEGLFNEMVFYGWLQKAMEDHSAPF